MFKTFFQITFWFLGFTGIIDEIAYFDNKSREWVFFVPKDYMFLGNIFMIPGFIYDSRVVLGLESGTIWKIVCFRWNTDTR